MGAPENSNDLFKFIQLLCVSGPELRFLIFQMSGCLPQYLIRKKKKKKVVAFPYKYCIVIMVSFLNGRKMV